MAARAPRWGRFIQQNPAVAIAKREVDDSIEKYRKAATHWKKQFDKLKEAKDSSC